MTKIYKNNFRAEAHAFGISKEDIFDSTFRLVNLKQNPSTVIIPHVCNNIGVFGGGFSGAIDKYFPEVVINFSLGGKIKLGHTQFITVFENAQNKHKIIIANMVAQNGTISAKNARPLHYPSLVKCMYDVKEHVNQIKLTEQNVKIHAPRFGSGLAGGNWNFIADLIDDIWSTIPVNIFIK